MSEPIFQGTARDNLWRYKSVLKELINEAKCKPRGKDDPLLRGWQRELEGAEREWLDLLEKESNASASPSGMPPHFASEKPMPRPGR